MLRARVAELERERDEALEYGQKQRIQLEGELESLRQATALGRTFSTDEQIVALNAVFGTIADGVVMYDRAGKIICANQAFHQMMGITSPANYLQLSMHERCARIQLRDGQGELLPEEAWPLTRLARGEVIASGEPVDLTFVTLDGREIQTDVSGAPILDGAGEIVGEVIVFHDITARKRLEKRTNDVLQTLLEMAQVLVQGTDRTATDELQLPSSLHSVLQRLMKLGQRVLRCTRMGVMLLNQDLESLQPVAVVGTSPEEMEQWLATFAGTRLDEHLSAEQIEAMLSSGLPIKVNIAQLSPSGRQHFYQLIPIIMHDQIIGIMALDGGQYGQDLSADELVLILAVSRLVALVLEREQLLEERAASQANELALLEANRRMDEFLSIVSHELRTPLTTINGNIQLAKRRVDTLPVPDGAPAGYHEKLKLIHELLSRAERQVHIQNRLVGDLLDVSRIQGNRLQLDMDDTNLVEIVHNAVEDQRSASPGRVILLHDNVGDARSLPVHADADRIGQVITNFLTNALKYSASDRVVEASIEVISSSVKVSIRDEGPGLPPEEQKMLWERFYRVPGIVVQSGSGVGLGLGLHICQTIIARHGGEVGVDSEVGKGSTFWFKLPLASDFVASKQ
ncbi:sensor histidine kinase [Dictyobacter formicarum]|nr:ATP-binding protein [Dictyobacter formicarum]